MICGFISSGQYTKHEFIALIEANIAEWIMDGRRHLTTKLRVRR